MTEQTQDPQPQSIKSATVSFGERMKREREMRGVKLEEIAESTKIGKRNLVALEQEQFDIYVTAENTDRFEPGMSVMLELLLMFAQFSG